MKQKTKLIVAVSIFLIAISLLIGLIFISAKRISDMELPTYLVTSIPMQSIEVEEVVTTSTPQTIDELTPTIEPEPTAEPTQTVEITNPPYVQPNNPQALARITIETDRKTRTYDIMPDVDENTLKKNLGHLPTSALFGEEGLCVIMGHRDTQFSILKYCEIGDPITILSNEKFYVYTVYDIQIIENDNLLQLNAENGSKIALISCFPFYYNGNAPKKIIIFGKLTN